ncbi:TPA: hypothetical protein ENX78_05870 [Candidatus Poribacteria bacterium]|nr:hypothetical protein [Candidatus Poribacteria bacterium]
MNNFTIPRKIVNIIGIVGFCLLIIVFGVYLVKPNLIWFIRILLGLGLVCILAYWIINAIVSRSARYGSNVAIMILLAFAILALVNFVSARHFKRVDTTQNRTFSLSEQTEKILKNLTQNITITAFYSENHYRRKFAEDILNEYAQKSNKIKFTMVDPVSKPGLASAYKIRDDGTVVFESGERKENVVSYENEEQDFTSAILKVTSTKQKKVYFLSGHGERDIESYDETGCSELKKRIEADNYKAETIVLAQQSAIPDDCEVLVIAGPQNPLLDKEEEAIIDYLDLGGKAIIMVDPSPSASMEKLLKKWGTDVHNDIILDGLGRSMLGDPSVPVCIGYGSHPITAPLARGIMTFFPIARSLAPVKDENKDLSITELVKTSNNSWGETNLDLLMKKQIIEYNEGQDIKGPLTVAVAVTKKEKDTKTESDKFKKEKERRVIVAFGDSDFVMNKYLQQGNPDLFMNSLNWLAEEEELISIGPKSQDETPKVERLSGDTIRLVSYSSIFTIPIILIIAGAWVWWKRR